MWCVISTILYPVLCAQRFISPIFIKELLKCKSLDDVVRVMNEYTGVCLITREEDDCLNSKGLTSKRPDGWVIAYNSCGIEVMDESQFNTYKQQKLNSTEDETID